MALYPFVISMIYNLLSKRTDIKQTIPDIKSKQKAIAYFVFAGEAFGLPDRFYDKSNLSAWLLSKKHDLNLSSSIFYYINRSLVYLFQRIIIGNTTQIIKSFYSKNVRQSVIRRLKDRKWYSAHLQTYVDFFARKKK